MALGLKFWKRGEAQAAVSESVALSRPAGFLNFNKKTNFCVEFDLDDPDALKEDWHFTDPADRYFRAGHRLMARGFFSEASETFYRATRYDQSHYEAFAGWSEALVLQGRADEAEKMLHSASDRLSRNCIIGAARAHVYLHLGDKDTADEYADIAVENAPDNAYVWIIAAEVKLAQSRENVVVASTTLGRARSAVNLWPNTELRIGIAMMEWQWTNQAVRVLQSVIASRPETPLAWILLGDAHLLGGSRSRAYQCYRKASLLVPELESVRNALSLKNRIMGRLGDAARAMGFLLKN